MNVFLLFTVTVLLMKTKWGFVILLILTHSTGRFRFLVIRCILRHSKCLLTFYWILLFLSFVAASPVLLGFLLQLLQLVSYSHKLDNEDHLSLSRNRFSVRYELDNDRVMARVLLVHLEAERY
jgi:hypothetical protein